MARSGWPESGRKSTQALGCRPVHGRFTNLPLRFSKVCLRRWTMGRVSSTSTRSTNRAKAVADDLFDRAHEEWDAGNGKKAFALFLEAATKGHPFSQTSLGYFYDHGIGVAKDAGKAMFWYRKAARSGTVAAINNLAITYRDAGNLRVARSWFEKAAAKGDGDAALELAKLSLKGTRKNLKRVREYLKMAVRSNYILADSKEEARKLLSGLDRRDTPISSKGGKSR